MLNKEKGTVLIIVVVIMWSVLMLLGGLRLPKEGGGLVEENEYGFGYLQMLLSDFYETHKNYLRVVVINLAEAGIDKAIDKLSSSWATCSTEYYDVVNETVVSNYYDLAKNYPETLNADKRFWVCGYKATISGNDADITGIGYVKEMFTGSEFRFNVSRKITISSTRSVPEAFNYGVYTSSGFGLETKNDITIDGNVHSNGNLEVKDFATVNGNVQSCGTASLGSDGTVTGTLTSGVDSIPLPEVDFDWYKGNADSSYTGATTFTSNLTGIIYVNGDAEINGTVDLTGVLVATGKIVVSEGSTFTHYDIGYEDYPALMSKNGSVDGAIELDGTVTLNSFIYTANTTGDYGKIELKGNVTINGSIISAGSVEVKTTAMVRVSKGTRGIPLGFIIIPELTSTWKEELLRDAEKL